MRDILKEEIRIVIFKMKGNTEPGPDEYTIEFFKANWNLVASRPIQFCFAENYMYQPMNNNIISLIFKVEHPKTMKEYKLNVAMWSTRFSQRY